MSDTTEVEPARVRVWLDRMDLDQADRCYARRAYRILRIAVYAPQSSPHARHGMYQGCYGMDRDEAATFVRDFFAEVAWTTYLGSK